MTSNCSSRWRSRVLVLCVLWLAAALRWSQPGLIEFKYDEAHITSMAMGVAGGGYFPLLSGGTSLGIQRSALDVYLLAWPMVIAGRHVEAAVWGMGALGVLSVALAYVLGSRVGGRRVALLTALFMAVNPWLIAYDRKLWAHIQVLFSVVLLLATWDAVVRRLGHAAFGAPVIAVLQFLCHVLALVQWVGWLMSIALTPRRWWRREFSLGVIVGVLLLMPYIWALIHSPQSGLDGLSERLKGLTSRPPQVHGASLASAYRPAVQLFTGDGIYSLAALPKEHNFWWQAGSMLVWPLMLVIGLGMVRGLWWTRGGGTGGRVLWAWTLAPLVVLSLQPMRVFPQYWTVLLPLPALYLALGLDWVAKGVAHVVSVRVKGSLAGALAVIVAIIWAGCYSSMLGAIEAGAGAKAFGVPLSRWQETLAVAQEWADRLGTQEIRVAVRGVDPGYESEPAIVATLIGNPPWARFVAPSSPAALLLAYERPSLYLWTIQSPETEEMLRHLGQMVWEGTLADDRPPARLYQLPPATQIDLEMTRLQPEPVFDVGMALMGYAFPTKGRAGQPLRVTLFWRVLDPPPEVRTRDVTAFNHILNEAGERVAQVDGMALLSRDWWPGDVLIQPYVVQLPPGTYTWRVGLYSRVDGGRAQVSTGGDSVDLGPLVVKP